MRTRHCSEIRSSNSKPSSNRSSRTRDRKFEDGSKRMRKVMKGRRRGGEDEGAREGGVRKGRFNE